VTRTIPLTRDLEALVDDDDYERLAPFSWYAEKGANTFYAVRTGPRDGAGKRERFSMHRVILGLPAWSGVGCAEVDHISRDGLDNRKDNLRVVTHQENAMNRANSIHSRPCPWCGSTFTPRRSQVSFCSLECANRAKPRARTISDEVGMAVLEGSANGASQVALAKTHGISQQSVSLILGRRGRWSSFGA
jgi:hypothetical protein